MLLTGFGGYDKLSYRSDIPIPVPNSNEVLIKVAACGINNTDIWTREGAYGADEQAGWQGGAFQFPRIQGADIVGQIVKVGANVSTARLGARVMVNPTLYAEGENGLFAATYIGSEQDGGFAEYCCVPDSNAHEINSPLSDPELATFMTAYLTAEHMLNRVELAANETVLITGASGGVGSALVQLARLRGAHVIAVVGKEKAEQLRGLGVDAMIFRGQDDYSTALQGQLSASTVDVVADVVAGDQVAQLINLLKVGGRYVTAGAIAGPLVSVDWRKLYLKHLTLLGATMGTQGESRQIVNYIASGKLKPLLAGVYRLEHLVQAQQEFKQKKHFGKLVVVP
jgi:NADPH:quinone reductase-like Zn-dependent oxidoreductase